jgi:hypothetical protein
LRGVRTGVVHALVAPTLVPKLLLGNASREALLRVFKAPLARGVDAKRSLAGCVPKQELGNEE